MASLMIVVLAVFVLSCGQTDTDADECFTPAIVVSVSNNITIHKSTHEASA